MRTATAMLPPLPSVIPTRKRFFRGIAWTAGMMVVSMLLGLALAYLGDEGYRAAAIRAHNVSEEAKDIWQQIQNNYSHIPGADITEPNGHNLLVDGKISALDLIVFGSEVVDPAYKDDFREKNIPSIKDSLFIGIHEVYKRIDYRVQGLEFFKVSSMPNGDFLTTFTNVHPEVVRHAEETYDGTEFDITLKSNPYGKVRYMKSAADPNRYFLMFVFSQKEGA